MQPSTALLIIDVQLGMFVSPLVPPVDQGDALLDTLRTLIHRAREASVPVVYVQHSGGRGHPLEEGTPQWHVHPAIQPREGEPVVRKHFSDCFQGTGLHELLQSRGIKQLVVAGIQTEFCVDTACRRAFSLGYQVTLVEDAHSTWPNKVLSARQMIAHHNLTLGSSFVQLARSGSLFQDSRQATTAAL
ncbi:MAG TPA: cysteine hydrolase family protein [Verrucomicrobiae bacterium]|jgi:nicotinamidase-related amidase|nr:cysteine hydrolase family protein [Verrucomicrobiae bacterium]